MHARHAGGLPLVHLHLIVLADVDAERFQTQATAVAAAAGSEEHRIEHTVDRAVMAERPHALAIALLLFAVQVAVSHAWLARFRFGPMEWLWRAMTYRQWPPMRRRTKQG